MEWFKENWVKILVWSVLILGTFGLILVLKLIFGKRDS